MKKIIIFVFGLLVLIAISTAFVLIKPSISRTCKIGDYGITIKAPYAYEEIEEPGENSLLSLYNKEKGISISAIDLKDDFWTSGDVDSRMNEYLSVISSANYDAELKSMQGEVLADYESKVGRVEFELAKNYGENETITHDENRTVTLITDETVGNVVIEVVASKENFYNNEAEIEAIIRSLKIKNK